MTRRIHNSNGYLIIKCQRCGIEISTLSRNRKWCNDCSRELNAGRKSEAHKIAIRSMSKEQHEEYRRKICARVKARYRSKLPLIKCVDCGMDVKRINRHTVRCLDCRNIYNKGRLRIRNRERCLSNTDPYPAGHNPLTKEAVDYILKSGMGNTLLEKDFLNSGYTLHQIPRLRKKYPDQLFPPQEEKSFCSCSLELAEFSRNRRHKTPVLREGR